MEAVISAKGLEKKYGDVVALDEIDLSINGPSIVGLLGKNGSGKSTLMRVLMGLHLPTKGSARTLGVDSDQLGQDALSSIGYVPQEICLLDWMTVGQHLRYVSTFYSNWDEERQQTLLDRLELDPDIVVGKLSQGNLQKLAIILAVCHHPRLLVLDEPVSDLDPIVRRKLLEFLLELVREDSATVLVSSHVLRDVEKVVDHVLCLNEGALVTDAALDDLKETYARWLVDAGNGMMPEAFSEAYVLSQQIDGQQAILQVKSGHSDLQGFCERHGVEVSEHSLNLEDLFPVLIGEQAR